MVMLVMRMVEATAGGEAKVRPTCLQQAVERKVAHVRTTLVVVVECLSLSRS